MQIVPGSTAQRFLAGTPFRNTQGFAQLANAVTALKQYAPSRCSLPFNRHTTHAVIPTIAQQASFLDPRERIGFVICDALDSIPSAIDGASMQSNQWARRRLSRLKRLPLFNVMAHSSEPWTQRHGYMHFV